MAELNDPSTQQTTLETWVPELRQLCCGTVEDSAESVCLCWVVTSLKEKTLSQTGVWRLQLSECFPVKTEEQTRGGGKLQSFSCQSKHSRLVPSLCAELRLLLVPSSSFHLNRTREPVFALWSFSHILKPINLKSSSFDMFRCSAQFVLYFKHANTNRSSMQENKNKEADTQNKPWLLNNNLSVVKTERVKLNNLQQLIDESALQWLTTLK